jgi:hypothetical protein
MNIVQSQETRRFYIYVYDIYINTCFIYKDVNLYIQIFILYIYTHIYIYKINI